MKAVNLQDFWSLQKHSDSKPHVFLSYKQAEQSFNKWNQELNEKLEAWKNGDRSVTDTLFIVVNEPNVDGSCDRVAIVQHAFRPGGIWHHPAYSVEEENWNDAVGYETIRWGNPATARPVRPFR